MKNIINNRKSIVLLIIFVLFSIHCNKTTQDYNTKTDKKNKRDKRIITLAPALTEIIYVLNANDKLVGNTKFCNYPNDAKNIKKIGGYIDMNIEMILSLNSNLIICYPEHMGKMKLLKNKSELLMVQHSTISDILNSIEIIGKKINRKKESKALINNIKNVLYKKNKVKLKKKVLLIADRDPDRLKSMYIIGNKDFLSELLELAGAKNCYNGNIPYPSVSIESIVSMNPDIIIELSFIKNTKSKKKILKIWEKYKMINAVKNGKIFFKSEDFWKKPGPRIIKIFKELDRVIN